MNILDTSNFATNVRLYWQDTAVEPMVWTKPVLTGPAPDPRHGHAAVAINDEIYFVGGFGEGMYYSNLALLKLAPPAPPAPPSPPPPPA